MDPSTVPGHRHPAGREGAGDAEVRQPDPAVAPDEQVRRLDVAVDEASAVGCREGPRRRRGDLDCNRRVQRSALVDDVGDARAVDELHDDEPLVAVDIGVEDRRDVGVRRGSRRAGPPTRTGARGPRPRRARGEELDRDEPLETQVARAPDGRHAARADLLDQLVAARQLVPGKCHARESTASEGWGAAGYAFGNASRWRCIPGLTALGCRTPAAAQRIVTVPTIP